MVIGLVQINSCFSGAYYLPYSVGLLQAYAEKYAREKHTWLPIIHRREKVADAVGKLLPADVVGFSCYVWNEQISLAIARELKRQRPDCKVVFGGPQVIKESGVYKAKHRFIDACVHGEGEEAFRKLLDAPLDTWPTDIRVPRMRDLSVVPSPFLNGAFDELMHVENDHEWLGLWETNRGCFAKCSFCGWGGAVGQKMGLFDEERLCCELDYFAENRIEFVFCCDANFGILPRDIAIAKYAVETKARTGYPKALSVQNAKTGAERIFNVQKILSDAGLSKGVTLSMQSMDETTLKNVGRSNIKTETYRQLQKRFTEAGIETYSDLILGMPGETYDSWVDGICELIEAGQHNRIQFNNLSILPDAEMYDPEYRKKHGIETVRSRIVNIHGAIEDDEVPEYQELVIATNTMPREDWVKARAFAWMVAFLHFDKVAQIPIIITQFLSRHSYREVFDALTSEPMPGAIRGVYREFVEKAQHIQKGGEEYAGSPEYLNIWWPPDELMLIGVVNGGNVDWLYRDIEWKLRQLLVPDLWRILEDAIKLNKHLLNRPHDDFMGHLDLRYDIMQAWQDIKAGNVPDLIPKETRYYIETEGRSVLDWCREVVWYGNKKGAYLYGNVTSSKEYAGHF